MKKKPVDRNFSVGLWGIYVQGELIRQDAVDDDGFLFVDVEIFCKELDLFFRKPGQAFEYATEHSCD